VNPELFRAALLAGAKKLNITVSTELAKKMTAHMVAVEKWANKISLTSVLEPAKAAEIHGLDSLLIAELFEPNEKTRVADVGSGGGFPGLVVALARPELKMRLLEPQRKRASFLRVALADLGRDDVEVSEERMDPVAQGAKPAWTAQAIISRATIPPLDLVAMAPPYLEPKGRLILTSGAGAPSIEEVKAAAKKAGLEHTERKERTLPGGETRILDVLVRR
jgi:16S rRNA (guanine527-N7)-methyltransferase